MELEVSDLVRQIQEQQGWHEATLLFLMARFISDSGMEGDFIEFLRAQAQEENAEAMGEA